MLKANQISASRGGRLLFEGVSFALSSGECLHIMGQNGVGKTTLLEALAGHNRHVQGSVSLEERSLDFSDSFFLGTKHGYKECLSALENLSFWSNVYGQGDDQAYEALSIFNLSSLEDQPYSDLSTGQKQRLSLARLSLINRPLWLLDEPFLGLDGVGTQILRKLLENHLSSGGIVCLTSHTLVQISKPILRLELTHFQPKNQVSLEDQEALTYV